MEGLNQWFKSQESALKVLGPGVKAEDVHAA